MGFRTEAKALTSGIKNSKRELINLIKFYVYFNIAFIILFVTASQVFSELQNFYLAAGVIGNAGLAFFGYKFFSSFYRNYKKTKERELKKIEKEKRKKIKKQFRGQESGKRERREPKLNPKYADIAKQILEDSFTPPPNIKKIDPDKDPNRKTRTHKFYIENEYVDPLKRELDKIVGQELAKKLLLSIIPKLAEERLLSSKHHKPVSFLLVGKTGVGKTETAKRVAEALKGVGYRFFRIDANQLRTPESVQSLFGSPRGYVGSDTVPLFIQEAVRSRGKMVILIDEIEKAHPDFIQAFMTLLDEGEVTFTTTGERIKLQDSFIFITSNLKADEIAEAVAGEVSDVNKLLIAKEMLKDCMLPEVLGRVNYVVPFEDLTVDQYVEIIRRKLEEVGLPADYSTAVKLYNYFQQTGVLNRGVREVVKTVETLSLFRDDFERIVVQEQG